MQTISQMNAQWEKDFEEQRASVEHLHRSVFEALKKHYLEYQSESLASCEDFASFAEYVKEAIGEAIYSTDERFSDIDWYGRDLILK